MTQAQLSQIVAAAVAAALQGKAKKINAKQSKAKPAKTQKLTKDQFLAELCAASIALGYANPDPNGNILTYDRWVALGRKVRAKEASIVVNGRKSGLFYISQTDVIG